MVIRELSREECFRLLSGARLARLACAHENQPYVVPVYLAYDEASGYLYGFTTAGQKVEWMRANPLVCVEMDDVVAYNRWVSVIANGHYEELPETPGSDAGRLRAPMRPRTAHETTPACWAGQCDDERERAWRVLSTHPVWGEPGFAAWAARAHHDSTGPLTPVYYRIRIDRVTGHEATPDATEASYSAPPAGKGGWLRRTLPLLFGGRSEADSAL
jgi:nitroimidazol reductase NimA-like FMN-containing flavoprotein (pyridoxamine 5'-phosphate oxidase superfamily)